MNNDSKINDILLQIEHLDKLSKQSLFEKLELLVSNPEPKKIKVKLSSISGLGASMWMQTNIDNYIDRERQW